MQLEGENGEIPGHTKFREQTIQFNIPKTGVTHQNGYNQRFLKHEVKNRIEKYCNLLYSKILEFIEYKINFPKINI